MLQLLLLGLEQVVVVDRAGPGVEFINSQIFDGRQLSVWGVHLGLLRLFLRAIDRRKELLQQGGVHIAHTLVLQAKHLSFLEETSPLRRFTLASFGFLWARTSRRILRLGVIIYYRLKFVFYGKRLVLQVGHKRYLTQRTNRVQAVRVRVDSVFQLQLGCAPIQV